MMIWLLNIIWLVFLTVCVLNALLVPRVRAKSGKFGTVLIPARNEAENLKKLLPQLLQEVNQVIVFDDGSDDGTALTAQELGATVIHGAGELPPGWTGKNHACWQLAKVAAETSESDWWIFLDADTEVKPGFGGALKMIASQFGGRYSVITGFPRMKPGQFPEPIYLVWVPWILLSTIPFGLITKSGKGHARFTNGQFVMWNSARYFEINPHEECRGEVLEDIKIGRMLAKLDVRVLTLNLTDILSVQMYKSIGQSWKGMLKNSYWVTGHPVGAVLLGFLLLSLAASVFLSPIALISGLITFLLTVIGTGLPWYCLIFFPLSVFSAGVTQFASMFKILGGGVEWKGRRY